MFFINLFVLIANIWGLKNTEKVSGQLPPREIGSTVRVKVRIRVGGAIFLGGNCPKTYENAGL